MQVNYDEKSGKGRDDASDYSAHSDESGEESGEEDTPTSKVGYDCLWVQASTHLASMLTMLHNASHTLRGHRAKCLYPVLRAQLVTALKQNSSCIRLLLLLCSHRPLQHDIDTCLQHMN